MPGYGVLGPDEGTGLLPWSWAEERLAVSRNFWVATVWPDGRPHLMPVWGVWDRMTFWFSSSVLSRKVRNLRADGRCTIAIEDALNPVVVEGAVEIVTDPDEIARFVSLLNAKYATEYPVDFQDPAVNATLRLRPSWAFGLAEADFTGSPTRWTFAP